MIDIFLKLLRNLNPETSHQISILSLKHLSGFLEGTYKNEILNTSFGNLTFDNPIGIAAGYDKNGVVVDSLFKMGFGFVECGTVTPVAQYGNPKPRIFRFKEDRGIVNRLGFNNCGIDQFLRNFNQRDKHLGVAGVNIGPNKDSKNFIDDYLKAYNSIYEYADYITLNVSSPNTKNLRDLQSTEDLSILTYEINSLRESKEIKKNIVLKVDPDNSEENYSKILNIAQKNKIDGLIVSNTSISRPESLKSKHRNQVGGLSGAPIKKLSNKVLRFISKETQGELMLIGVGGIESAQDIYEKIKIGASLVQIYSALTYNNVGFINEMNQELSACLINDGFSNIKEAVGIEIK
tara:strand:+ start:412 stop:1458 length:1047 start_codon:yes stop_codon:yes gene_type:complete